MYRGKEHFLCPTHRLLSADFGSTPHRGFLFDDKVPFKGGPFLISGWRRKCRDTLSGEPAVLISR